MKNLVALLVTTLVLFSCGKKDTPAPLSEANPIIKGTPAASEEVKIEDKIVKISPFNIVLEADALKQTFLLTVAEIEGAPTPTGSALGNKVVYFIKKGNRVFMFESLDGQLTTDTIQTRRLLAEFPIVSEGSNGELEINFKEGMTHLFERGSYYTSDRPEAPTNDDIFKVTHSYLEKVEVRGKHIFIDQYARIQSLTARGAEENKSIQLKYTFSTYKKNDNFKIVESNQQKRVGYFEVHPIFEAGSGKKTIPAMHYDPAKEITFHLTSNIPEEYKEAVQDGVLYWNRVFGKDKVKVATLPDGIGVHEPGYNTVVWLHWDTAGFAYANMMGDPLTGETLQSHVYMTSVFGKGGFTRAKRQYKQYVAAKTHDNKHGSIVSLKGFESAEVCHFNHSDAMMKDLGKIIELVEAAAEEKDGATEEEKEKIFLRFSQDYVRQVVAHEVGHALGLRHNFAGSLSTTIKPKLYDTVSKVYFLTGKLLPGMVPTSTVMDYTPGMVASMIGAHIRLKRPALTYDKQAIDFAYSGEEQDVNSFAPFCTDTHRAIGKYNDCKVWDRFENVVAGAAKSLNEEVAALPFRLAYKYDFLNEKKEGEDSLKKIKAVQLTPKADAEKFVTEEYANLLSMTSPKAEFIAIRKEFADDMSDFDLDDYKQDTLKHQSESVADLGGLNAMFTAPLTVKDGQVELMARMRESFARSLKNLYSDATEEELTLLKDRGAKYLDIFEKEFISLAAKKLNDHTFAVKQDKLELGLLEMVKGILFTKSEQTVGTHNGVEVKLPLFDYVTSDKDLRKEVALVIKHDFYPNSPSYMRKADAVKKVVYDLHKNEVETLLGTGSSDDLSDELYDWLVFEKKRFSPLK